MTEASNRPPHRWHAIRSGTLLAAAALLASLSPGTPANAAPVAPLRVGVDFVPPAPSASEFRLYTPESFDVLVAEKIAEQLGRKLELVELAPQDRATALSQHDVEIVLARMGSEQEQCEIVR